MPKSTLTFCLLFLALPSIAQQRRTKDEPEFPKTEEIELVVTRRNVPLSSTSNPSRWKQDYRRLRPLGGPTRESPQRMTLALRPKRND